MANCPSWDPKLAAFQSRRSLSIVKMRLLKLWVSLTLVPQCMCMLAIFYSQVEARCSLLSNHGDLQMIQGFRAALSGCSNPNQIWKLLTAWSHNYKRTYVASINEMTLNKRPSCKAVLLRGRRETVRNPCKLLFLRINSSLMSLKIKPSSNYPKKATPHFCRNLNWGNLSHYSRSQNSTSLELPW